MENAVVKKRVNEFLNTEKSGEGKKAGKPFKDALAKFVSDLVFEAVKEEKDNTPMAVSLPEADAVSVGFDLAEDIGVEHYYVIFKQVRSQVRGKLQLKFGWQFTVLKGKVEEIQIRGDHGVLYKLNGDWVLRDLVFKSEADAVRKCNTLNEGTESVLVVKAESPEPNVVRCERCGAFLDANEEEHRNALGELICAECAKAIADGEDDEEVEVNGEEGSEAEDSEGGEAAETSVDTGSAEVGVTAEGNAD